MAKKKRKRKTPPQYKSGPKKGQFKPSGRKASPKRKRKPQTRTTVMARRRRRRPNKKRRATSTAKSFEKRAASLMIGGAAYGFLTENNETVTAQLAKIPKIINADLSNGIAIYILNKYTAKNKYVEAMAMAALVTGATKFGQSKFAISGEEVSGLSGFDDAVEVGGMFDDEDLADLERNS